jgi:hypothetical protein
MRHAAVTQNRLLQGAFTFGSFAATIAFFVHAELRLIYALVVGAGVGSITYQVGKRRARAPSWYQGAS